MDATIALNLAALAISVTALTMTALLTMRQIRVASGANHLPVILNAFREIRSGGWFEAEDYILRRLAQEHSADCGWRGLPPSTRAQVTTIGLYFDDLGKLVAHEVIDQRLVIGAHGTIIVRLWDVLAPYVYAERQSQGNYFWVYFEDLAARTAETHPDAVYATMRRRPPQPRHLDDDTAH